MSPQPVVVLGADGRIGNLLCSMRSGPWEPVAVTRSADPAQLHQPLNGRRAPIVVCTRNDDLAAVVEYVHPSRHPDLVFVQNGLIRPWLVERKLESTPSVPGPVREPERGVLWVAVPRKGDTPVPGGPSVFAGHWADTLSQMLDAHGVDARSVPRIGLAREEAVKLAWICATGVIGSATGHGVGGIDAHHAHDLELLVRELFTVLRISPGIDIDADALVNRVKTYSKRIPHFPARLKEWRWRNGAVLGIAESAGLATPVHDEWLRRAGGPPG
jgi:hypothetical protein